ncbi:MAG: DUF6259 domain-containing protein [Lentisphaeria bacterium]|nr:DUF6259 domain-containing protein [Lentisphaeria bacterium]
MKKNLLFCLNTMLCAGALFAQEALQVNVRNNGVERFAQVVSMPVTEEWLQDGSQVIETDDRGNILDESGAVLDRSGKQPVVSWLMYGITEAGAVRHFQIRNIGVNPPQTDLTCEERDGKIVIGTTYFQLEHPMKGHGGMPQNIRYGSSGYTDTKAHLLDRVFNRETHSQYTIMADDDATAKVVFKSPLRVVVEAHTGYKGGGSYAPDNLHAVYRYIYTAYSPVVDVTVDVERGEGPAIEWNELHFLHLSRQDKYYTHFVTGEPMRVLPMREKGVKGEGIGAEDWAVLSTNDEAMGVSGHRLTCWDASDEFVYYVSNSRQAMSVGQKSESRSGSLYFGPASDDNEWFTRWLGKDAKLKIETVNGGEAKAAQQQTAEARPWPESAQQIDVKDARLVFADASEGFACQGLVDKTNGTRFFDVRPEYAGLWVLEFRKLDIAKQTKNGEGVVEDPLYGAPAKDSLPTVKLTNRSVGQGVCEKIDNGLRFTWKNQAIGDEKDVLDVICDVTWNEAEKQFEFRMSLANRSKNYGLWTSEYPALGQVFEPGKGDALLPGGNWGARLFKNNREGVGFMYPCAVAPMQFMAFNLGDTGVYFAAHDSAARPKRLLVSSKQDISYQTFAENMGQPGAAFATDFPVVLSLYHGDWWQAAKKYRKWALQQPWTAKGPIAQRKDFPQRFIDNGFWMCLGGEPKNVEKTLVELDKRVNGRVPFATHWYNWHKIPFDHSYPNYFPTKDGFAETTARMKEKGQLIMPYINGRLWDMDIDSFPTEGIKSAAKNEKGEPYIEIYGSKRRLVPNCPFTKQWQNKIQEICSRLMNECGVNGIYLDQIGAAAPKLCFDPTHNHPIGGGRHWCDGYRAMLTPIKEMAAAKGVTLTTENIAEPYMDNIDGFLTWVQRNQEDVPAMTAVYSGYAIYFTSPMYAEDDFDAFRACQGRDFLWGCQLGWNGEWIMDAKHNNHLEYLIRLGSLQKAAKEFMVLGELLGEVPNYVATPDFTTTWHLRSPHNVTLKSVQSTLWKNPQGDLLMAIVNYSDSYQTFTCKDVPLAYVENLCEVSRLNEQGEVLLGFAEKSIKWNQPLQPREICLLTFRAAKRSPENLASILKDQMKHLEDPELKDSVAYRLFKEYGGAYFCLPQFQTVQTVVHGEPLILKCTAISAKKGSKTIVTYPNGQQETIQFDKDDQVKEFDVELDCWDKNGEFSLPGKDILLTMKGCDGYEKIPLNVVVKPKLEVKLGGVPKVHGGETFILHTSVKNNSRYAQSARILVELPEGWKAEPSNAFDVTRLKSGGRKSVAMKVTVPERAAAGQTKLTASVVTDTAMTMVPVQKSRPQLAAKRFNGNAEDMDKWPDSDWTAVGGKLSETVKVEKDYGGEDDQSGRLRCLWDDANLYIVAEVKDNIFEYPPKSPEVWLGDCVQLAFRNGPMNKNANYDGRETEFALADGKDGAFVFRWEALGVGDVMKNARISVSHDGNLTTYRAVIPWKQINIQNPARGQRIPFSFTLMDNDGKGFHGYCEWTRGICEGKDSSQFGWLILE